jgi:hypothetical protein
MKEEYLCSAHLSDGSGQGCKKAAMRGQSVCRSHGGAAPAARAAADRRLDALLPKALNRVEHTIDDMSIDAAVRLRASFGVMDRRGIGEVSTLRVEHVQEPVDVRTLVARSLQVVLGALDLGDAVAYLLPEERQALESILTAVKGRIEADATLQETRRALAEAHEIPTTEPGQGYD